MLHSCIQPAFSCQDDGDQGARESQSLSAKRAEALLVAARESAGAGAGLESRAWILRRAVRELVALKREIRAVEVRMARWLEEVPCDARLPSMLEQEVVTAATLLGECGDLKDYPYAREALKFVGLNVVSYASGPWQGRNRISKRGSRLARQRLYLLAGQLAKSAGPWRQST